MKKTLFKTLLLLSIVTFSGSLLSACGKADSQNTSVKRTKKITTTTSSEDKSKEKVVSSSEESTSIIESSSSEDENNGSSDVENTDYGKVTTIKEKETNKQIKQGDLSITIKNVKILKYEPKNKAQLSLANFENVKNPYYVVQFNYDVTNNSNKKLDLSGVSAVDLDSKELGQVIMLQDNGDTYDADAPVRVNPGVTKTVTCQGLLKEDMLGSLNKLSVTFGEVEDKDYNTVTEEADPTSVDIN